MVIKILYCDFYDFSREIDLPARWFCRLGGSAGSVVEYVNRKYNLNNLNFLLSRKDIKYKLRKPNVVGKPVGHASL